MQRAADGANLEASSGELGVLVAVRWCGVEVARLGVVLRSSTPEPTAAPTGAVRSEGGMDRCRRLPPHFTLEFQQRQETGQGACLVNASN